MLSDQRKKLQYMDVNSLDSFSVHRVVKDEEAEAKPVESVHLKRKSLSQYSIVKHIFG